MDATDERARFSRSDKAPAKEPERTQVDKFRDLAREREADEDEAAFEEALKRIAKKSPPPPVDEKKP